MQKVVSEISGVVFSLPWLIAKDEGLFEAEGIDMEFVRTRPSGAVAQTENPEDVWMVRWGLIAPTASTDDLVDNRVVQAAALLADDS